MTSLEYTMTVRDVVTGQVQVYAKTGPDPCGGWDTQSFPFVPTPTPPGPGVTTTQTPTVPSAATGTPLPGATRTPPPTLTPTGAATITLTSITPTPAITPTPTPTPPPVISLRCIQWQWDFFSTDLGVVGGSQITLQAGKTYQVFVYNGDAEDVTDAHYLSSVSGIGLQGGPLPQGGALPMQTITPDDAGRLRLQLHELLRRRSRRNARRRPRRAVAGC